MTPVPAEVEKSSRNVVVNREPFIVPGFKAAAAASGMRYQNRLDLALIVAETPAIAAGVFTTNRFSAAPVQVCKEHLRDSRQINAILVNAGYANACTGEEGVLRALDAAQVVADALHIGRESILVASTGVIGPQISIEPIKQAIPSLLSDLRPDGWDGAARAIMTTDTFPKPASARIEIGGRTVTIGGIAKGSGMIAPDMATLLAFVCTDAAVEPAVLKHWVQRGADCSFNAITVDGDTSTNDSLLVLASGYAKNPPIADMGGVDSQKFGAALLAVLKDLAKQIVLDGEGATKFIEILITGAPTVESAKSIGLTIANSPLVKTAFFGGDANWGRIVAAAGRAGVPLVPERSVLYFDDVCVFRHGAPVRDPDIEARASQVLRQKEIKVQLDLGMGGVQFTTYTCDLSYDYVKINADYRS
jgi:glutamate N-acetyltransferase/amino-acid N-acetyltransferase